jgi:outer membrane protein OmpA-like peptidoglycan-associated protein
MAKKLLVDIAREDHMSKTTAAARLFVGLSSAVLIATLSMPAPAAAQAPANPTQQGVTAPQDQLPVFRVTVVGRSIAAVNYRPRHGETRVDFAGTPLMPKAKGWAQIEGKGGYIDINAHFDDLGKATQFGREYLTYVLWAITPEGRATNLGEVQIKGDSDRIHVTTELQAFALMVTAEPYFAVTQPSDVVVMENVVRDKGFDSTEGRFETVQAKYELLKRGTYLMNQDYSRVKLEYPKPGEASDLAQAHNAVEFARIAGADRFASDTFAKAQRLLADADNARRKGGGNKVMQPARQAAQTAEDSRLISLQRQEEAYQAEQQRLAEQRLAEQRQREADARERARLEEERRRQAEQQASASEAARLAAEQQRASADAARAAADQQRLDAERQRQAADQAKADAERSRLEAERAKAEADAARLNAERQAQQTAQQAADAAARAERERAELREQLRQQLSVILETRETARGLIVNVSDVLFDFNQATLKPGAREKLAKVAGILGSHPGLKIEIEGHTDSIGSDDYNQRLSERRAQSVSAYLTQQGVREAIVGTVGFGESRPVATNGTAAGRQQNRRVEIVVSGEPIAK